MRKTLPIVAFAAFAAGLAAAPATATEIAIRARVSTVCRIETPPASAPLSAGYNDLGQFTELCNNLAGYRLILAHPAGLRGASALVDGRRVPLEAGGYTVLTESLEPAFANRHLAVELGADAGFVAVSLKMEPRGPVY